MSHSVFLIVGEPSGDNLGGPLIKSLKEREPSLDIMGIGGPAMQAEGLDTLMPMEELCVMGLWEVLGQLPRLLRLVHATVEEIEERDPDYVITIDLPDFNFRVGKLLKQRGKCKAKLVHYVAPTVWAWRPGRAKKIAEFLDGLLCLFPFEPEYFTAHGLSAKCVGHPLIEENIGAADTKTFRKEYDIRPAAETLGLYFGSRGGEISRIAPIFLETLEVIKETKPNLHVITPTLPAMEYQIIDVMRDSPVPYTICANPVDKWAAMASCDAAIAVSGTVGLELALAAVPHVIGYKMHPLSWFLLRQLATTKYAHLANILMDYPLVPEYLQGDCTSLKLAQAILEIMDGENKITNDTKDARHLRSMLEGEGQGAPSDQAADFVLNL
jgi:lipid-A-disaccharide synthase